MGLSLMRRAIWLSVIAPTKRPGVPHGRIPHEECIVKDGKSYYPFSGLLNHVQEDIQYHKHRKWGLLIYRCDYSSNDAWSKFLSNLKYETEKGLRMCKAENLQETLEMTPKEDKKTLDGATVDQVRETFKEWVRSSEARAEINDGPCGAFHYPRYTYCVHVDASVLDSVVNRAPQPPEYDPRQIAYVNLLQLRFEDFAEDMGYNLQGKFFDDNEVEENSVKVPLSYIGPESYNKLYDPLTFDRYVNYRRSDGVSWGREDMDPEEDYGRMDS